MKMINYLETVEHNNISNAKYYYNNIPVPRVTEIISKSISEDYLMRWANSLGWKRKSHIAERDRAAFIGTQVHKSIEKFLKEQLNFDEVLKKDIGIQHNVVNALESFIKWYSDIYPYNNINIVFLEKELVCPYFGGTADMLISINNKNYLVDFKTSNHVSYKYFLQLSAYKYILNTEFNINVDGFIILQLDKNNIAYNEYVLNFDVLEHHNFMKLCSNTFLSLTYSYYNILQVQQMYKQIFN